MCVQPVWEASSEAQGLITQQEVSKTSDPEYPQLLREHGDDLAIVIA